MKIRLVGAELFCGGRTDRRAETNSTFSQFCESTLKFMKVLITSLNTYKTLETEQVVRGLSLLKCRPREVRPKVENTLFDQSHGCGVVSNGVAGRKAKYTQSSGTLSITAVLLIWKPR